MRITLHSTLTISICALALLSQTSSVHSAFGVFKKEGSYPIDTFAQEYVEENKEKLGLSNIRWSGGNGYDLCLARATWQQKDVFMKCDTFSNEVRAFKALVEAKDKLTDDYTSGQQNVMDPLDQFEFYKHNRISYFCYLYSFIDGVLLEDYFEKRTVPQAFITTAEILPDIIEGLIYLYNAGINHHDLYPSNIMIQRSFFGRIVGVKIIDFDSISLVEKRHDWQPINTNDEEYRSLNPIQKYESCNGLKKALIEFLNLFVPLKKGENPYAYGYVLTKQAVLGYLDRFKGSPRHISLRVGDIKAVIPAIYYLLKVHYTIQSDPFPCSSPMRALEGLPPRTL